MPSVLAEISFVTQQAGRALLKTGAYRQQIAEALFDAVITLPAVAEAQDDDRVAGNERPCGGASARVDRVPGVTRERLGVAASGSRS